MRTTRRRVDKTKRCDNNWRENQEQTKKSQSVASELLINMVVTLKFTLIIFLPLLLIDEANALKCFQCNSKYDRKCANDELIDSKYVVECSDVKHKYENELPATFCMKLYKKCKCED